MARLEITREQYEQWKGTPGVQLDMECKYWMTVGDSKPKSAKRKSPKNRRDPNALIGPGPKINSAKLNTMKRVKARAAVLPLVSESGITVRSSDLGKFVAKAMGASEDMGSYYVTQLINAKVLEVVDAT